MAKSKALTGSAVKGLKFVMPSCTKCCRLLHCTCMCVGPITPQGTGLLGIQTVLSNTVSIRKLLPQFLLCLSVNVSVRPLPDTIGCSCTDTDTDIWTNVPIAWGERMLLHIPYVLFKT